MYAILETGGKQYKVKEGDVIEVEHINQRDIAGDNQVNFAEVLLIHDKELHLGQPFIPDAIIKARILEEFKAPKIIVFKKKSKKGYRRTRGHRQMLHRLKIEKIEIKAAVKSGKEEPPAGEKKTTPAKTKTAQKAPATGKKTTSSKSGKKPAASTGQKKTSAKSQPKTATRKTPKSKKENK